MTGSVMVGGAIVVALAVWIGWRRTVTVPCEIDLAATEETFHAHVALQGVEVNEGDAVLVHQAPSRNMWSTPKVPMVGLDRHRVAKVLYRLHLFPVPSEFGSSSKTNIANQSSIDHSIDPHRNVIVPPSTGKALPVMKLASSLHKKSAAVAISSGWPMRPIGKVLLSLSNISASWPG